MLERINKASPKYDRWVDEQEIGISVDTKGMQSNEIEPIIERAKNDLGIIFNVMPAEYRDFIKKHTKELKICELSRQSAGVYGKLSCNLTDWRSRPLQAIIRHDYFYRPNATNNDERGFEFKVIIEDSKTDELMAPSDGMRISEEVRLEVVNESSDKLVDVIRVEIGATSGNDNESALTLYINESGEIELYVEGVDFKTVIEDIAKRFPAIGELVMPSHAFHPGRYAGDKKMWNLSMQKKQAEEFRNAVREQITLRLKVYGG